MIISPGRRFIFVHIPKTGGTSLALALEARAMRDDILVGSTPKAKKRRSKLKTLTPAGRLWEHATLADIEGVVNHDALAGYFKFTLVRNPWDRIVSYYHWLRAQSFDHDAVARAKAHDFSGFLNHPFTRAGFTAAPSAAYMRDVTGALRCDAFIRLERFETDAAPLFEHLGFRIDLGHANRSRRTRDYRPLYSGPDRALVAEICRDDIARFGYAFDDED